MAHLEKLEAEVAKSKAVNESAIVLLSRIAEKLQSIAGDEAAVMRFANDLSDSTDALAAAVVANTPAEDEPDLTTTTTPEP